MYELSLSIGQSLELQPACDRFLTAMMARKNLALTAVWLREEDAPPWLAYANPRSRVIADSPCADHPISALLTATTWQRLAPDVLGGLLQGRGELEQLIAFPLRGSGLLILGATYDDAFTDIECNQLRGLVDKFAVSVEACRAHEANQKQKRDLEQAKVLLEDQAVELEAAREAAERASAYKSRFLAQMSHELRTPLTSIIGYTDLMQRGGPRAGEWLRHLRAGADHLLAMVNDVLDLSSIEAGRVQIARAPVALRPLLGELISLVRPKADAKGLLLGLDVADDLPAAMITDATRLRQILINLLGNAIKYTPHGHVTLRACLSGSSIRFAVEDTGVGLSEAQQAELFRPFTRFEKTSDRNSSGLGLSIAQQFARAMGGDILVTSTPKVGSTFTLVLHDSRPVSEPAPAKPAESGPPDLSGRRILVVEDTPDIRRILSLYLSQTNAEVTTAPNGLAGVVSVESALAAGTPYDLILMDVQMPELDGYAAAARLRHLQPRPRIIITTAYTTEEDIRRARRAGCAGWLGKPVRPEQLYEALRTHLPTSTQRPTPRSDMAENPALAPLLEMYRADLRVWRADMLSALDTDDTDSAKVLLHRLKGSAGSYGYPGLSGDADRAQQHLRDGGPLADIQPTIDTILADTLAITEAA